MTALLPTRQAALLQDALIDYLTTTFALADSDARTALTDFLQNQTDGIFKGPYIRTRLPFATATGWENALEVLPAGFTPYGHQAQAFKQLSSRTRRPQPTLVTTGTGSGKTECFLLPVLDHVLRARQRGEVGVKALILYPMNALANDQAQRLTRLITTENSPYAGINAAIYTGEQDNTRKKVTENGLVNDRHTIRAHTPDILLTNYKMLDQLLLRHDDASIWANSAGTLQYVVLDEFHTYDGAQGTDVAMLLRRLGLALKSYWPARGSAQDAHTAQEWERPLGNITPVGTSATLGDGHDATAMLDFASEIFGETFTPESVITESRMNYPQWSQTGPHAQLPDGYQPTAESRLNLQTIIDSIQHNQGELTGTNLARTVLGQLIQNPNSTAAAPLENYTEQQLLAVAKALPLVQTLIETTKEATGLDQIAQALCPTSARSHPDLAANFVSALIAVLSHLRAENGRSAPAVETHLWVRELTRIDRSATTAANFSWSDDGIISNPDQHLAGAFPAIYCRHCGRSGWGIELATTGDSLSAHDKNIRYNHMTHSGRFRALISAPAEGNRAVNGERVEGLAWFDTSMRAITTTPPTPDDSAYRDGQILPVLMNSGEDVDKDSRNDVCPSCQQRDGIRFLGAATATMLSVSLSSLFGDGNIEAAEKKALVFTDSVQDAAHRAGFISSRSHVLTMRSIMRDALGSQTLNLEQLAQNMLTQAGDDPERRYRLVPADLLNATTRNGKIADFWEKPTQAKARGGLREQIRLRLLFDAMVEFGMSARYGRTLEATSSVTAYVDLGDTGQLQNLAREVLSGDGETFIGSEELQNHPELTLTWVRAVVERMRSQGAIDHPWLKKYLQHDGERWEIWGGRPDCMPAFPRTKAAPTFPRVGRNKPERSLLDAVSAPGGWYVRWTARTFGISSTHAARLVSALLEALGKAGLLNAHKTNTGGIAYALDPKRILLSAPSKQELQAGQVLLACDVCHGQFPASAQTVTELSGAPCLFARCTGALKPTTVPVENFYRTLYTSPDMRRIIASEHSSLLETNERLNLEDAFKSQQEKPGKPNTLVATPTLEMGIDIGDLSAVFLASLPRTVASYLQRIGRAGRATGNALNLAYVTGRGEFLPRLGDPTSLINGAVRPPSIYLSAEEILRRQYLAFLADHFARDRSEAHHPRRANAVMQNAAPGSFLGDLIELAQNHAHELLDEFLGAYQPYVSIEAAQALRAWATPTEKGADSGLVQQVYEATQLWNATKEELEHRQNNIAKAITELEEIASLPAHTKDDELSLRTAKAAARMTKARLQTLNGEYWISVLEEFGLLPNYTLLGDAATLDVAISWFDPETNNYQGEDASLLRGTDRALTDFAPGATFYARGLEIKIDAIDLGTESGDIRTLAFCAACGYGVDTTEQGTEVHIGTCPRCGDHGIQDMGQRIETVELQRSSAVIRRDEARIDDRHDDRQRTQFSLVAAADIDPHYVRNSWYVKDYEFGAKYLDRVTLRWLNLGRIQQSAEAFHLDGETWQAAKFRVCEACGHLDTAAKRNTLDEHRPWCKHRKSLDEHSRSIALTRTLTTQGVLLPLPWAVTAGDKFSLPSLQAALLLGLRDEFGGSPDHIGTMIVKNPNLHGENTDALLLHDTVPGGTGYLAELASPQRLWRMLLHAYQVVRDCPCQHENRQACHRCLLPLASGSEIEFVSRRTAQRHLRALLTAGQDDAVEPGAEMTWKIAETLTPGHNFESHLEGRFRQNFLHMAEKIGATINEVPGTYGNIIELKLGTVRWKLEPQVNLDGVRPDFMLTASVDCPPIAIFTDGYRYHATSSINRIADDAEKRAMLRAQGVEVLAITSHDLDRYEAGDTNPDTPTWLQTRLLPTLMQAYNFSSTVQEAALNGPMGILATWIQQTPQEAWSNFSNAMPLLWEQTARIDASEDDLLGTLTDACYQAAPTNSRTKTPNAWWWRHGALGVLARKNSQASAESTAQLCFDVAIRLDASEETVAQADFREDWETWLTLSNLMMFRPANVVTDINVIGAGRALPNVTAPRATAGELSAAWQAALSGLGELDHTTQALAVELETAGITPPDLAGEEIGKDWIPIDFAWNAQQVAVILEPDEEDMQALAAEGWTVLQSDTEQIVAAMKGKLA